jgi:hypothetical protein
MGDVVSLWDRAANIMYDDQFARITELFDRVQGLSKWFTDEFRKGLFELLIEYLEWGFKRNGGIHLVDYVFYPAENGLQIRLVDGTWSFTFANGDLPKLVDLEDDDKARFTKNNSKPFLTLDITPRHRWDKIVEAEGLSRNSEGHFNGIWEYIHKNFKHQLGHFTYEAMPILVKVGNFLEYHLVQDLGFKIVEVDVSHQDGVYRVMYAKSGINLTYVLDVNSIIESHNDLIIRYQAYQTSKQSSSTDLTER